MKSIQHALTLAIFAVATGTVHAVPMSPKSHPSEFCELAAELGYPSRGFKEHTGACASNMTDVSRSPGRNGLNNNLAFYSMGMPNNSKRLQRVSLILNVNNVRDKTKAHSELARVARSVATKILGEESPQLGQVIQSAGSKAWQVGQWSVEVKTDAWTTGLGYDISVYFRPK
jgi:hypothetical protein